MIKHLKSVVSAFNEGNWKRKQNVLVLKDEEIEQNKLINQLVSLLMALSQEKEDNSKHIQQFEQVQTRNSTLTSDLSSLKEENQKLRN